MAYIIAYLKRIAGSPFGGFVSVLIYIIMLMAICLMFTGGGEFIYEGF